MIKFSEQLIGLAGLPIGDASQTLGAFCINALLGVYESEGPIDGVEKLRRWQIATRIQEGATILSTEDISLVKRLIGLCYPPLVVGPAWTALDPSLAR